MEYLAAAIGILFIAAFYYVHKEKKDETYTEREPFKNTSAWYSLACAILVWVLIIWIIFF